MRHLRYLFLILAVCCAQIGAQPDIGTVTVVTMGTCSNQQFTARCFILKNGTGHYLAIVDQHGVALLFTVVIVPTNWNDLDDTMLKLLWARDAT